VLTPVDDDEILEPPGHDQLTFEEAAEVAGSQVRPFASLDARAEDRLLGFGTSPIAGGHAPAGRPDLPDLRGVKSASARGIHDSNIDAGTRAPASREPLRSTAQLGRAEATKLQRVGISDELAVRRAPVHARHHQRAFGKAVTGSKGVAPKADRGE